LDLLRTECLDGVLDAGLLPGKLEEAHDGEHLLDGRVEVCEYELPSDLLKLVEDLKQKDIPIELTTSTARGSG